MVGFPIWKLLETNIVIWSISTVEPLEILTLDDEICVHCDYSS